MAYSYNNIIRKREPKDKAALDNALRQADPAVEQLTVAGVDATVLHGVLSPAECATLRTTCEECGFTFWANAAAGDDAGSDAGSADDAASSASSASAFGQQQRLGFGAALGDDGESAAPPEQIAAGGNGGVAALGANFRTAQTIEVDLPQLTAELWRRIAPHVPTEVTFDEAADPDGFERDCAGRWVAEGLAANLLFARYDDGGHFAPHIDGTTVADFNRRSFYTVLVYLNTCGAGGETHVLSGDQCEVLRTDPETGKVTGSGANVVFRMPPTEGSAMVFRYNVLHEGTPVVPGHVKYIIRGDVYFQRTPPILTAPGDLAAFEAYQAARVLEAEGDAMGAVRLFL